VTSTKRAFVRIWSLTHWFRPGVPACVRERASAARAFTAGACDTLAQRRLRSPRSGCPWRVDASLASHA
jgi:hypothetical protein